MNTKYLAIAFGATLSILSFSSVAKAALTNNAITANAITANGLHVNAITSNAITSNGINITGTMPRQTGLTLSTSGAASIQVAGGHLVLAK